MKTLSTLLFAGLATVSAATEVTMTRQEASNLHKVLTSIPGGLSPNNTIVAADDATALLPFAEAYERDQQSAARSASMVPGADSSIEKITAQIGFMQAIERKAAEKITVDLTPFDLSADEVKDAKLNPAMLSILRRFLSTPPPKK